MSSVSLSDSRQCCVALMDCPSILNGVFLTMSQPHMELQMHILLGPFISKSGDFFFYNFFWKHLMTSTCYLFSGLALTKPTNTLSGVSGCCFIMFQKLILNPPSNFWNYLFHINYKTGVLSSCQPFYFSISTNLFFKKSKIWLSNHLQVQLNSLFEPNVTPTV